MNIEGKKTIYQVISQLSKGTDFNTHKCVADGKEYFLKIASSKGKNYLLEREQFILETLYEESVEVEKEYQDKNKGSDILLNNHFFFPLVYDSFQTKDGSRYVLILDMSHISKTSSDLAPMSFILRKDNSIIDPKTSVWILGKLLKMLVFVHDSKILVNDLQISNILLNKSQHYVSIYNWSKAEIRNGDLDDEEKRNEIVQVTKSVVLALGGNDITGAIPVDDQMEDDRYPELIKSLIQGTFSDALQAHQHFYEIARSIWPSKFHNFTTKFKLI